MEQDFYYFTIDSPSSATALLYGEIGFDISATSFVNELLKVESLGITDITIRISSFGGDVFEGFTIFTALQKSKAAITTYNDCIAASIAALIFLGGKRAIMADYATLMIHNPWSPTISDKTVEILSLMRQSIITILSKRTNQDKNTIGKLMDSETWFCADEALELGFATSIEETEAMVKAETVEAKNFKKLGLIYNSILKNTKIKNKAEDATEVVSAPSIEKAPEAAVAALDTKTVDEKTEPQVEKVEPTDEKAEPQVEKVEVTVAGEPVLEVEKAHVTNPTQSGTVTVDETAAAVLEAPKAPATTELAEIKPPTHQLVVQAELEAIELINSELVRVNQELSAKLASVEVALNAYKVIETAKVEAEKQTKIQNLVDSAVKAGKISADSKASWSELAKNSFDTVKVALDNMFVPKIANRAIDKIINGVSATTEKKIGLRELEHTNPKEVERLYKEDRLVYNQLFLEAYGVAPKE